MAVVATGAVGDTEEGASAPSVERYGRGVPVPNSEDNIAVLVAPVAPVPEGLEDDISHRYGRRGYRGFRYPIGRQYRKENQEAEVPSTNYFAVKYAGYPY